LADRLEYYTTALAFPSQGVLFFCLSWLLHRQEIFGQYFNTIASLSVCFNDFSQYKLFSFLPQEKSIELLPGVIQLNTVRDVLAMLSYYSINKLLIRPQVKSHAYKYPVMLACPASFFKKDSRQAGMTNNVVLLMNSLVCGLGMNG
jgi:hypothetical protein